MDKQLKEQLRLRESNKKANEQIRLLKQEAANLGLNAQIRNSFKSNSSKRTTPQPSIQSTTSIPSKKLNQSGGKSVKKRKNRNQNQNQKQKSNKKTYIKRRVRKNIF
jgi:hypothetical protein